MHQALSTPSRDTVPSRRQLLAAATAGAAALTAATLAGCSAPGGGAPSSSGTPLPSAPPVSKARLQLGLATSTGPAGAEFRDIARALGQTPAIASFYKDFTQDFPLADLEAAALQGSTPMICWEPWVAGTSIRQPDYSLARLIDGSHDDYLKDWGRRLGEWNKPVMLRFAHEMNGSWRPWGETVNGNKPGQFVQAWRHVHQVVSDAAGGAPLQWVWSPNENYRGGKDFTTMYPGHDAVDVVAVNGYNWGNTQTWSTWRTPAQIFNAPLAAVRKLAPGKAVLVGETGCAPTGGSRPAWLAGLVTALEAIPEVTGFVLFEGKDSLDWRIGQDPASIKAFAKALGTRS
jgi:hypothetical protein